MANNGAVATSRIRSNISPDARRTDPNAEAERIREYWTPARKAAAIPIELPILEPGALDKISPRRPDQEAKPLVIHPRTESGLALAPEATFTTALVAETQLAYAPYRSIGKLFFDQAGSSYSCSASLIAPNVVLTAAHCAYSLEHQSWSTNIVFDPQYDNGAGHGVYVTTKSFVSADWIDNHDYGADYAILVLLVPAVLPTLGLIVNQQVPQEFFSVGYPAKPIDGYNFDGQHMWQSVGPVVSSQPPIIEMGNNMTGGCSGGPWLTPQQGQPSTYANGVNSFRQGDGTVLYSPYADQRLYELFLAATGGEVLWETSLPGCGYGVTSVLYQGGYLYAACNGRIYQLNPVTGQVVNSNPLPGFGTYEVRLATDGSNLYVGTNGYALSLSLATLNTNWSTSLPGCGYAITSVLAHGGYIYAGCNGHVYQLDGSGSVMNQNGLPGRGNSEIRLAADGNALYVGTNGYALALSLTDVSTTWQTSLPGCGYQIVDVATGNGSLYAGSNGFVYRLDTSGNVAATNNLSGFGYHEVRLALNNSYLFAGTNGYALALDPTSVTTKWSTSLPGCGYTIVTMLTSGADQVYAGSNGYVYQLAMGHGAVTYTNNLPGLGFNEVRLATDGKDTLFVGSNGFALGLEEIQ